MEEIEGYVEHIIFRNADNGYTVFVFICGEEEITCVGTLPSVGEGESLLLQGQYTSHPTYGDQFQVRSFQVKAPEDAQSMERYLASGAIKGIGVALAARIVRRFKGDTFRIMEEEPERLAEVKGISERMAMDISTQMMEKRDLRDAMIFLEQYGIHTNLAVRIYQQYGPMIYSVIRENPYRMADEVPGIGFRIADEIASRVGIRTDSDFRIRSGILYVLSQGAGAGHTYLPRETAVRMTVQLLGVPQEAVETQLMNLAMDRKIVIKGEQVYAKSFYHMEEVTAGMLRELDVVYDVPDIELEAALRRIEKEEHMVLDERQAEAVKGAVTHGLFILTGGPGTGKTTSLRAILEVYDSLGITTLLTAPTGRAAKRVGEVTGRDAATMHRLLGAGFSADGERVVFAKGESDKLDCGAVVLDECSMVDIILMDALLQAMPDSARLILVGDADQLPSVGPGRVFADILRSGAVPAVRLTEIFRQAETSRIVSYAHEINAGEHPRLNENKGDFYFLRRPNPIQCAETVAELCSVRLPGKMGIPSGDIQVLSPTRRGEAGTVELNKRLQAALNPPMKGKNEKIFGDVTFREGDRVMQIRNNYDMIWRKEPDALGKVETGAGIYNGDIGYILAIDVENEALTVDFDGRIAVMGFDALVELEHAWAITVHKSQGSEYRAVVLAVADAAPRLMTRGILYTAVTRARELLIATGDEQAAHRMIDNHVQSRRYSGLRIRLREGGAIA